MRKVLCWPEVAVVSKNTHENESSFQEVICWFLNAVIIKTVGSYHRQSFHLTGTNCWFSIRSGRHASPVCLLVLPTMSNIVTQKHHTCFQLPTNKRRQKRGIGVPLPSTACVQNIEKSEQFDFESYTTLSWSLLLTCEKYRRDETTNSEW